MATATDGYGLMIAMSDDSIPNTWPMSVSEERLYVH